MDQKYCNTTCSIFEQMYCNICGNTVKSIAISILDGCIVWNGHNTVFGSKRSDLWDCRTVV